MYWTRQTIGMLSDAPWPMTKSELLDYVNRTSGNKEILENIEELEDDDDEVFESLQDICTECEDILDPYRGYRDIDYVVYESCA